MPTIITISGPIPAGLPNAGTQGTNSITIDDSPASQAFIAAYLYEINYRPTIPDPTWSQTVDDGHGNPIPNPIPQGQVLNPNAPGKEFLIDLQTQIRAKAKLGAPKLEAAAVAIAQANAATFSAAVDAVNFIVS